MILKIRTYLLLSFGLFALTLLLVCAQQPRRVMRIIPLTDNILTSLSAQQESGSLAHDGIEVSIVPLTRKSIETCRLVLKPILSKDIATLSHQGYVNYTDTENLEIIKAYKLAGRYPYSGRYDKFSNGVKNDGWQINPYLARAQSTLAFKIIIENRSTGKVMVQPSTCRIVDSRGKKYNVLRKDTWHGFAPLAYSSTQALITWGRAGGLTGYFIPYTALSKDTTTTKIVSHGIDIYPSITIEGVILFSMVEEDVREFSVVLPNVIFYNQENEIVRKRDFVYRFMVAEIPQS